MMHWLAVEQLAIVVLTLWCAKMTRDDRNYWPMLRVIWSALAAIYAGAMVNTATGNFASSLSRIVFTNVMLVALLYAAWFMRKRNRTPRFIRLDVAGDLHLVPLDELERAAVLAESWAHHGAMTEETVARLEKALAQWRSLQRWRIAIGQQAAARRAQKAGK